uniref:EF-hand domain-containing protein n=1 Tax=Magallana gigas TaxID=29159 RepID=K1QCG8_MAGGI
MDAIDYTDDYLLTRFLSFVNVRSSTRDSLLSLPLSKCEVFTRDSARATPVKGKADIEDDQETVLDITAPHVPYDDTGRRTYEKICQKLDVVPSSKILRKLAESPSIDIRHYGLGPKGTMAVSVALVDVSDNHLKTFGAKAIGMMLQDNKGIRRLSIAGNEFTDLDATFLTKEIEDNMKLKLVNASWNGIDDEGALAFSDCLSNNAVLTELDISCSRIGDKGYAQVMRAFKKNEDLEVLRIGKNNIKEETVKLSIDLLKEITTLKLVLLDLSDVMLGASVVKELESLEEVHPNLEVVHGYTDSYGKRKMAGFADLGEEALWIIKEFIEEKDLTVAKLFAEFDEDGSNSVDYDEFRQGIKVRVNEFRQGIKVRVNNVKPSDGWCTMYLRFPQKQAKIPLSSSQVDALINFIDMDGDGDIDFSELVLKMKEITKKRKEEDEQRAAEARKRRAKLNL